MAYTFGARLDDDSYALTTIDEDQGTSSTKGEINGVPFESGGGGSSDFSTATVTWINNSENAIFLDGYVVVVADRLVYLDNGGPFPTNTTSVLETVLYKGSSVGGAFYESYELVNSSLISIEGDAEIDAETGAITITGDCTITVNNEAIEVIGE